MFGGYDSANKEWTEGIVSHVFRRFFESEDNERNILAFDGPIDSKWTENLNSIIDDNRNICLSSSETIHLNENSTIVFETDDLSNASPATVKKVFSCASALAV